MEKGQHSPGWTGMRLLPAAGHRRMPWKNGGGVTVEIAVSPAAAGIDAFDWRISMASVKADGPFSAFPGVDRTLAILDGAGMVLSIAGRGQVTLTPDSDPLAFPADVATEASLLAGPVTDLNVMTRRGRAAHRLGRLILAAATEFVSPAPAMLFCAEGGATVAAAGGTVPLARHDALLIDAGLAVTVAPGPERTVVFMAEISAI